MKNISYEVATSEFIRFFADEVDGLKNGLYDSFDVPQEEFWTWLGKLLHEDIDKFNYRERRDFIDRDCNTYRYAISELLKRGYAKFICSIEYDKRRQTYRVLNQTLTLHRLVDYHNSKIPNQMSNREEYVAKTIENMLSAGCLTEKERLFLQSAKANLEQYNTNIWDMSKNQNKFLGDLARIMLPVRTGLYLPFNEDEE
jgi:hypothetical protein